MISLKHYKNTSRQKKTAAAATGEVATSPAATDDTLTDDALNNDKSASIKTKTIATEKAVAEKKKDDQALPTPNKRFSPPSRTQLWTGLAFGAVVLLGAVLRFWGLGDKPLHHDESLHAYYSWQFLMNVLNHWSDCAKAQGSTGCYTYNPLLHGPFQFHAIAITYKIAQWLHVYDNGINNVTARIPAATLGSVIVAFPYFLRDRLGKITAWVACFLLAVSPSMVYFARFAREDIYMACFTLALVVAVSIYWRTRKVIWLVLAAAAFSLSYATKEATFLTVAVFGSFLGALVVWELGSRSRLRVSVESDTPGKQPWAINGAPVALVVYALILALFAKWFFGWMKDLSAFITDSTNTNNKQIADAYVQGLESRTLSIIPWLVLLVGAVLIFFVIRDAFGNAPASGRRGLAKYVDPRKQPVLNTLVTIPWTHWFPALFTWVAIFIVLFTVLFTNISGGIGDGIWQGIYYWIQQIPVARGGQPWYYYFLLIPLYEQIGLVFGLVGLVRCLLRPTRFRLFLAYWFVGNVAIYTWASEKMPWLMIHMTMPMMLLAAIGLEPVIMRCIAIVKNWWAKRGTTGPDKDAEEPRINVLAWPPQRPVLLNAGAVLTIITAVLLLLPTVHNMYEVTYIHPADAPHEMMIYVQSTNDVQTVMSKIDALDQKLYGGKHKVSIGIMSDATWPFAWYVRDYPNICFGYPTAASCNNLNPQVILAAWADNLPDAEKQYGSTYTFHHYAMRSQWDQGYMPPPCVVTATNPCTNQPYSGVGPLLWLSYGDTPPPGAQFDLGRAASNIWQWWWYRKAFGDTHGTYDMDLFIRNNLGVAP
jgi:uncharacterized protein (TIGR03663 family)